MLRRQKLFYRIFVVEQVCPYFLQTVVLVHHKRIVFLVGIQGRLLLRTPGPVPFERVMSTNLLSFEHPSVLLF